MSRTSEFSGPGRNEPEEIGYDHSWSYGSRAGCAKSGALTADAKGPTLHNLYHSQEVFYSPTIVKDRGDNCWVFLPPLRQLGYRADSHEAALLKMEQYYKELFNKPFEKDFWQRDS